MDKESRPAPVEREVFLNEVLPVGDCGLLILHSSSPPQRNQPLLILLSAQQREGHRGSGDWGAFQAHQCVQKLVQMSRARG